MKREKSLILVVEDNADNRILIKDVLDSMDYDIVVASDGVQGVETAVAEKPTLILMDLSLPLKDGWQATRELKANPETKDIPIIALTAHAMLGDKERAFEAGCDGYVSKPIDFVELTKELGKFLNR